MNNRYSAGKHVAITGIAVNILLLIIKFIVGFVFVSQAMIADGFNSVGDVFASIVTLIGSMYAAKPEDREHVWGHGKAEYIASMLIGFSMIAMAVYSFISSVASVAGGGQLTYPHWLVIVAVITIALKGGLFVYTNNLSKRYDSLLIEANAQDHRNDVFVTVGTLVAVLLSTMQLHWVDGVVGMIISTYIVYSGVSILRDASTVLMDSNVNKDKINKYKDMIGDIQGVDHVDSVVAKPIGAKYILIVKVSVDRHLNVLASHDIAKEIENELLNEQEELEDVIVHINPDLPHE